ncbi:APC family permease [Streptomyces natalensis]|uniref:APC family permease n=1 Tax=Streptomyces natalensis TaxID=68242 RepID=UPI0005CB1201|nr:amino acid permease [Streptomyces natalensis]
MTPGGTGSDTLIRPTPSPPVPLRQGIGIGEGTALYVGAVLGGGLLALPALAARVAGPASLIAWAAIVLLCIPVASAFTALGTRYPDGGGIATFVTKAFGRRAATPVGWSFYFTVPVANCCASIIGGEYVAGALGGGRATAMVSAAVILVVAYGGNWFGLRMSGRMQLAMVGLLMLVLLTAVFTTLPQARTENLEPFAPHGWLAVGGAVTLLFYSFAGWEAVTHLSHEFSDPRRQLPRIAALSVAVVAVVYLGLAVACVAVLGPAMNGSAVPLTMLMERSIGGAAQALTVTVAIFLSFGTVNAYAASGARLGAALGRDGALPKWFAKGSAADEVPRRSLAVLAAIATLVMLVLSFAPVGVDALMTAASVLFVTVYVAGLAAAVRLLRRMSAAWCGAVIGLIALVGSLVFFRYFLLLPVLLVALAEVFRLFQRRRAPERSVR